MSGPTLSGSALTRRAFLGHAAAGAAALALPRLLWRPGRAGAAGAPGAFDVPLPMPPVLTGEEITLPIRAADVPILPGAPTRMWTFGGSFPGPTIRRPTGATTRVTFAHELPEAGTLTLHHHGHHTASADDGQPMRELLAPGASRTYTYDHREEGSPLRGALRWYHDHSHGRTGRSAWMGLVGLFVLDDPAEASLGLPGPERELLLVVTERTFDAGNQLVDPFTSADDPGSDAVGQGEVVLVNGVPRPYAVVEPTRYRLRVLNAASFTPYNIGFAGGPAVFQVGTESGLLPSGVVLDRVLLGPAERADLVVDFTGLAGQDLVLSSALQQSDSLVQAAPARSADLVQFRVRGADVPSAAPAASLGVLPPWAGTAAASPRPDRVLAFGRGVDPARPTQQVWTINGRPYDPAAVAARPELGAVESWLLVNASAQSHYVHLHDVDWLVVQRNGVKPPPWERGLKETFRLDPGDTVLVAAKFTDHLGPYMVHCHMLSHEDHAMMTTFEVVPPGQGDRPASALDRLTAEEAARVRAMLAAQARRPGAPAPPPARPLRLAAGAGPYSCRLAPT